MNHQDVSENIAQSINRTSDWAQSLFPPKLQVPGNLYSPFRMNELTGNDLAGQPIRTVEENVQPSWAATLFTLAGLGFIGYWLWRKK